MSTEPPEDGEQTPAVSDGINPSLRRGVDAEFTEDQHGSAPLDTVSQKSEGPAVWPVIWAVVTIVLVLITIWLLVF